MLFKRLTDLSVGETVVETVDDSESDEGDDVDHVVDGQGEYSDPRGEHNVSLEEAADQCGVCDHAQDQRDGEAGVKYPRIWLRLDDIVPDRPHVPFSFLVSDSQEVVIVKAIYSALSGQGCRAAR